MNVSCVLFTVDPIMIITEYMENGSLDEFLKVSSYVVQYM